MAQTARLDDALPLMLDGLRPNTPVTVAVSSTIGEATWVSVGTFISDPSGRVDTSRMRSTAGTYTGRSVMGLFWSQHCVSGAAVPSPAAVPIRSTVQVRQGGETVRILELRRWVADPDVEVTPATNGLVGTFFLPLSPRRIPVLVLGGSEGGQNDTAAALLASHGHPALALTYFGVPGLPPRLEDVPLDYVRAACKELTVHATPGAGRRTGLAVYGVSKGGELGLVLGATHPDVVGVAAMVPSFPGVSSLHSDRPPWAGPGAPAVVPMAHVDPAPPRELVAPATAFRTPRDGPVRTTTPTLLVTTGDDTVLPPLELLENGGAPLTRVHVPGAGHLVQPPHLPTTATIAPYGDAWLLLGGSAPRNAVANRTAWRHTLRFLRELGRG